MGRREYLADFADGDVFGTSFLRRPDAVSRSMLNAFAPGPRALNDPTEGLLVKGWYCRCDNTEKKLYLGEAKDQIRLGWHDEVEWFTFTGDIIQELDFAFDQNGAPVLVAQRSNSLWIYYFKPSAGEYVFEDFGAGLYPKVLLDNPFHVDDSDLLVWYSAGGFLTYRKQRDLYVSSNPTAIGLSGAQYVEGTVVDDLLRIHVIFSTRNAGAGTWSLERMTSELYPYYAPPEYMLASNRVIAALVETVLIIYTPPPDTFLVANSTPQATLEIVVWEELIVDNPAFDATIDDVQVILVIIVYEPTPGECDVANTSVAGTIEDKVIEYTAELEEIDAANSSIAGTITTP